MKHSIATLVLVSSALAQGVPYDQCIVSNFANIAPCEGLMIVSRTGTVTNVTGLLAAGSAGNGVNAVRMDPIDDRIWLGGINQNGNTPRQVNWCRIGPANTVTQFSQHATVPGTSTSISAIAFDDNGNPVVTSGTLASGGGVYRVSRSTPANVTLITQIATGTHNAICRDPAGNMYLGMTGGAIHKLVKNLDGSFQAPVLLGTIAGAPTVSGITWAPIAPNNEVLVTTFGAVGNNVFRLPANGGAPVVAPTTFQAPNWIEYDRRHDDFLLASGGINPDEVIRMTRANASNQVCILAAGGDTGSPSFIDSNDDANHDIRAVPMILNGTAAPFNLELCASAPPGDLVFLGMSAPFGQLFGFGVAPANGRVHVTLPNIQSAGLPPNIFTFVAASINVSTNALTVGVPLLWPSN